jgi:hypothetical protein
MQDPSPSNIHGSKVQQHSVEWQVNVGHVLLGLAAIYVAAKFGPPLLGAASGSSDGQEERVDVEVNGLTA